MNKAAPKYKGFMTAQSVIEAAIVFSVIAVLSPMLLAFSKNGENESIKLRCLSAGISATERIKNKFMESGSIDGVAEFSEASGGILTEVVEVSEIRPGSKIPVLDSRGRQIYDGELKYDETLKSNGEDAVIYRVALRTTFHGANRGANLIVYLSE